MSCALKDSQRVLSCWAICWDMLISSERKQVCLGASFHSAMMRITCEKVLAATSMSPVTLEMLERGSAIFGDVAD